MTDLTTQCMFYSMTLEQKYIPQYRQINLLIGVRKLFFYLPTRSGECLFVYVHQLSMIFYSSLLPSICLPLNIYRTEYI